MNMSRKLFSFSNIYDKMCSEVNGMGLNEFVQIGNKIKKLRKEKGITQKEMAKLCGIPYSTYSNYENNNREPSSEQLRKIASALSIQAIDLIYEYPEQPDDISPEHPIAFPGLEKKLSEIGYSIRYEIDYVNYDDNEIWIVCPDGEKLFLSLEELETLDLEMDMYLKFRIDHMKNAKGNS